MVSAVASFPAFADVPTVAGFTTDVDDSSATGVTSGSSVPVVAGAPDVLVVSCAAVDRAVDDFVTAVYIPGLLAVASD